MSYFKQKNNLYFLWNCNKVRCIVNMCILIYVKSLRLRGCGWSTRVMNCDLPGRMNLCHVCTSPYQLIFCFSDNVFAETFYISFCCCKICLVSAC